MKCFVNTGICIGNGKKFKNSSVVFGEKIVSIGENSINAEKTELPEGCTVFPGFIDCHVHGAGGCDVMDASYGALEKIALSLAKEGTTAFLATTMTHSRENLLRVMRSVREYYLNQNPNAAELLGVHLEGPFISPKHIGAQSAEHVVKPDINFFAQLNEESGGLIKLVTVAPEILGAEQFISYLVKNGIGVSLGHTGASYGQIMRAVELGAESVTHTFNAQSGLHHREIGTVGAALLCNGLYTELIADGVHVSAPAMRLLAKCKSRDKLVLITDAIRAKDFGEGRSELGGQTVFVKNGEARLADGTLAGSVLKMNEALRNLVKLAGVPVRSAAAAVSLNAARRLKTDKTLGSIEVGKKADFAVLDKKFDVICTVKSGRIIYMKDREEF